MTLLRANPAALSVLLASALALGACAAPPARRAAPDRAAAGERRDATIEFANEGLEPVDVWVRDDQREWRLGRVGPGARTTLRVPDAAFRGHPGYLQVVVVPGEGRGRPATRSPRAMFSIPQPANDILSQKWRFADGQVRALQLSGSRRDVARP